MHSDFSLLFRTARGVVPEDAGTQDVVQETWLRRSETPLFPQ